MKKLKFNSFIAFLTIGTSLLILSCSKDEEKAPQSIITTGNNQTNSTSCDILGSLNVGRGTYTYTYTSNSVKTNINWTITPSSAANIISGQGTATITITFNSSCRMSAFGSGGTRGICEDIKSITKNN